MDEYKVLFIGDFYHGESYPHAKQRVLDRYGYRHATVHLEKFLEHVDCRIFNLETPIVDPQRFPSPFEDEKEFVHWSDPEIVPKVLTDLGVDAVSLANNHTLDHGVAGLTETIKHLSGVGIEVFGAGEDLGEAARPYTIPIPASNGASVNVYGFYEYRRSYDEKYAFYADSQTPGCNPLRENLSDMHPIELKKSDFNIAFPHWGANYRWPRGRQLRQRRPLTRAGFNFVLGHGSHCLQGFTVRNQVPVFYGIGNGVFQSPGRFKKYQEEYGILPYGAWAILTLKSGVSTKEAELRLYPVYANNRETDFQPRPVEHEDFETIVTTFNRDVPTMQSRGLAVHQDKDALGFYFRIDLGAW